MNEITINAKEAAKRMNISMPTFYELAAVEGFPCIRVGKKYLVSVAGLERWVNENLGRNLLA